MNRQSRSLAGGDGGGRPMEIDETNVLPPAPPVRIEAALVGSGKGLTEGDVEERVQDKKTESFLTVTSNFAAPKPPKPMSSLTVPAPGGVFPLANSQQVVASSSSGSATGNPRNKIALARGFSLMDWIRLTKSGKDLANTNGRILHVTNEELAKHSSRRDAWMALNGKVYNVTAYMDYHPGGFSELLRGAGKDGTDLFNEVHRWVNYENMLAACLVGKLVSDKEAPKAEHKKKTKELQLQTPNGSAQNGLSAKPVIPPIRPRASKPTHDFHQTDSSVSVSIFTRCPGLSRSSVIAAVEDDEQVLSVLVRMLSDQMAFLLRYVLEERSTLCRTDVRVSSSSGKIELRLEKRRKGRKWRRLGDLVQQEYCKEDQVDIGFRPWKLKERREITHDVDHLVLEPAAGLENLHFFTPFAHHVRLRMDVEGLEVVRSYTPVLESLDPMLADDGRMHILVKTYQDGAMTPPLKRLDVGKCIDISNHHGIFNFSLVHSVDQLVLLAAGTGFTPMARIIQAILVEPPAEGVPPGATVDLLFFNKTERDIIWRRELEKLAKEVPRFRVEHILSQADENWTGHRGRISREILRKCMPEREEGRRRLVAVCGSNPFVKTGKKVLKSMFVTDDEVYVFQS